MMTWDKIAEVHPEFVQWAVQAQGLLPVGRVKREDYDRLKAAYESRD